MAGVLTTFFNIVPKINFKGEFDLRDEDENRVSMIKTKRKEEKSNTTEKNETFLGENEDLAELTTIILGDGNIYRDESKKYMLRISSNKTEEKDYREYTKELIEKLFNYTPKSYPRKGKNAVDLTVYNKKIVNDLIAMGLEPGNKVHNQVKVPDWIKNNDKFKVSGLRGLFDTDGSVYQRNTQKTFGLNFKNGSLPLVEDFKAMCESIGIKTQKIPKPKISRDPKTGKIYKTYMVNIEDRSYIAEFLYRIKPKKWENHSRIIGMALQTHNYPEKRTIIKNRIDQKYPDKKLHFNEEYENTLKNLCEEQGIMLNNESIIKAIKKALTDKRKEFGKLNSYAKGVIRELEYKFKKKSEN